MKIESLLEATLSRGRVRGCDEHSVAVTRVLHVLVLSEREREGQGDGEGEGGEGARYSVLGRAPRGVCVAVRAWYHDGAGRNDSRGEAWVSIIRRLMDGVGSNMRRTGRAGGQTLQWGRDALLGGCGTYLLGVVEDWIPSPRPQRRSLASLSGPATCLICCFCVSCPVCKTVCTYSGHASTRPRARGPQ